MWAVVGVTACRCISIRDASRGKYGAASPPDFKRTPSKIGYEIQINNRYPDPHPTGSIYGFMDAKPGSMRDDEVIAAADNRANRDFFMVRAS